MLSKFPAVAIQRLLPRFKAQPQEKKSVFSFCQLLNRNYRAHARNVDLIAALITEQQPEWCRIAHALYEKDQKRIIGELPENMIPALISVWTQALGKRGQKKGITSIYNKIVTFSSFVKKVKEKVPEKAQADTFTTFMNLLAPQAPQDEEQSKKTSDIIALLSDPLQGIASLLSRWTPPKGEQSPEAYAKSLHDFLSTKVSKNAKPLESNRTRTALDSRTKRGSSLASARGRKVSSSL